VRVLQVIQEMEPGGAERLVLTLAERLEAGGHRVDVAAAPGPRAESLGLPDHALPKLERRPYRLPGAAFGLRRALRRAPVDVVHAHNPGMAAVAALATRRGRRLPALVTSHGVAPEDDAATARVLRLAGLPVVACGPGVAAGLAEHGVEVRATVCNAVGPAPPAADRAAVLRELGLDPSLRLVVSVGRLVHQKHHDLAVEAFRHVPGAALVIVGGGPEHAALEAQVAAAGLQDRVRLTGARDDARSLLGAAEVALLPSRWEGLPLVALEAATAGVPIVATEVRGVRELFRDGVEARLASPDDASAIAGAVRAVLEDAALARRLADGAARLVREHGEERMVQAYLALYEELV
jgi:glycosyltransferase involved in cell wall biosynthesis